MTSLPVLIAVLHVLLFVSALCLRHDQPASAITRSLGAAVWGTVSACLAAIVGLSVYAGVLPHSTARGTLVFDQWSIAFAACSMAAAGLGMFAGAEPTRALMLATVAGLSAGTSSGANIVPILLLGWLLRDVPRSGKLPESRLIPWNSILCTLLAVLGMGIVVWHSGRPPTAAFLRPLEAAAMVCVFCGAGGLVRWFPFPYLPRISDERLSLGGVLVEVLLPGLAVLAVFARLTMHLHTDAALSVIIIGCTVPALIAGARLLSQEHLAEFSGWLILHVLSLLCAPLALLVWEQNRTDPTGADAALDYWAASGLADSETLLATGLLTLVSSVLLMSVSLLTLTATETSGQFLSSLDGSLSRRPARTILALTGLWFVSALPPSPGHWWRLQLVASLTIAHRQSSLTRLFEPFPAFLVLIALTSIAWGLAILGTVRVLARILWEEPLSHSTVGSKLAIVFSLLLLCLTLLVIRLPLMGL